MTNTTKLNINKSKILNNLKSKATKDAYYLVKTSDMVSATEMIHQLLLLLLILQLPRATTIITNTNTTTKTTTTFDGNQPVSPISPG